MAHRVAGNDDLSLYCLPADEDRASEGKWMHLAASYDGKTRKMSLYLNGKQLCTRTRKGEIQMDEQSAGRPLVIGAELNGPSIDDATNKFDGYLDEVRIYDRALSSEEIKTLADQVSKRVP